MEIRNRIGEVEENKRHDDGEAVVEGTRDNDFCGGRTMRKRKVVK